MEDTIIICKNCEKEILSSKTEYLDLCSKECSDEFDYFITNSEECSYCGEFVLEWYWHNEKRYCSECINEIDMII